MINVIVAEKGGAEHRLEFQKAEISIGRIKGNDVVLPKGNVSKRHSRVVLKDGRFIIVDLKSTNGTYVNGRKITSPVVVKGQDKIYIGDFILSLEPAEHAHADSEPPLTPSVEPEELESEDDQAPATSANAPVAVTKPPAPSKPIAPPRDPVKSRIEQPAEPAARAGSLPPALPSERPAAARELSDVEAKARPSTAPRSPSGLERKGQPTELPWSKITLDVQQHKVTDINAALKLLMRHIARVFDVENPDPDAIASNSRRHAAERHIEGTIHELDNQGLLDPKLDRNALARAAYHEALGLGPLENLMVDQQIEEILVVGTRSCFADFGEGLKPLETVLFSSSAAVLTAAKRLMGQSGLGLKSHLPIQQGRLADGSQVTVWHRTVAPQGPIIRIRKVPAGGIPAKALIERGMFSEDMLELMEQAMARHLCILVCGPPHAGVSTVLSALANSVPREEWLLSIENDVGLSVQHPKHLILNRGDSEGQAEAGAILQKASQFRYEWLIADDVVGAEAFDLLEHIVSSSAGTLIGIHASGVQDPLQSFASMAKFHARAPSSLASLIAEAVHLVVELNLDEQGHPFVSSIREPTGSRGETIKNQEIFTFEDGEFLDTGKSAKFLD